MIEKLYPKSSSQQFGLGVWLPSTYNENKKYLVLVVGHGQGETGNGSVAALRKVIDWGGWDNIQAAVDREDIVVVFLNTEDRYDNGEYIHAINWIKSNLAYDENSVWYIGHSLGSYGAGNWGFTNNEFARQLAGWVISSTGGFSSSDTLYRNIFNNQLRVWGVTAENDGVVPYTYVTRVADRLKAFDVNYPVIMTVFPETTWPDRAGEDVNQRAHNNTIGRITQANLNNQLVFPLPGPQLPNTGTYKMNLYQWMKSNPKGSIFQPPTDPYVGPKYKDEGTTTTTTTTQKPTIQRVMKLHTFTLSADPKVKNGVAVDVTWKDDKGVKVEFYRPQAGDRIIGVSGNFSKQVLTVDYAQAPNLVLGPTKTFTE